MNVVQFPILRFFYQFMSNPACVKSEECIAKRSLKKGVKRKMLTSDWFASAVQVKPEDDVNILRLTPFSLQA